MYHHDMSILVQVMMLGIPQICRIFFAFRTSAVFKSDSFSKVTNKQIQSK